MVERSSGKPSRIKAWKRGNDAPLTEPNIMFAIVSIALGIFGTPDLIKGIGNGNWRCE